MQRFLGGGDGDNMYMTTSITSPGAPVLYNQKALPKPFEIKIINRIDDIPGTVTVDKFSKYATKPQFNAAVDLPESIPKVRSKTRNVPDRQLMITDIDGAQYSAIGGMERTNRFVDPLQPEYKLPSFTGAINSFEVASQKPVRDIMNTSDIPGTKSNMNANTTSRATKDVLNVNDIDGAKADYNGFHSMRQRFEVALNKSRNFGGIGKPAQPKGILHEDYQPITFESKLKFSERTTRRTDPVQPIYHSNGVYLTDDVLSKPKQGKKFIDAGTFSLTTQDIVGATSTNSPKKKERREVRDIMNTMDVQGAQADTVVHSIVSERVTCPLFPIYKSLDDGSPMQAVLKPLVEASEVKSPSLRLLKMHLDETAKIAASKTAAAAAASSTPPRSARSPAGPASSMLNLSAFEQEQGTGSGSNVLYSPVNSSRSPINSSRSTLNSARSGGSGSFFSPIRSESNQSMGMSASKSVPHLNTQALYSARSSGSGRSGGGGKLSASELSRRQEVASVRSLPE